MRDPNRIDETLELISNIWKKYPDLRLCQLIGNISSHINNESPDLYFLEDSDLIKRLKEIYGDCR